MGILQEDAVTDPHWHEFQKGNGDESQKRLKLAEGYAHFFFGVTSGQVAGHLEKRPSEEVDNIVGVMRKVFVQSAAKEEPTELKLAFALIVLRRR